MAAGWLRCGTSHSSRAAQRRECTRPSDDDMSILVEDRARVRTLTLDRPDALNAFDEALYDATTEALLAAATDPDVAVVMLTGNGRAFSAGDRKSVV